MKYRMLDIFSGLGGASRAMQKDENWEVITVDIDPRFHPTVCADVLELTPDDLKKYGHFDLIWASPPCTYFSIARQPPSWRMKNGILIPQHRECVDAIRLVYHTLYLIDSLNPTWWFLENPRGFLRFLLGKPSGTVDYCQYGHKYRKPTDLWGRHPPSFEYRRCGGNGCHHMPTPDSWPTVRSPAKRAEVPYGLSLAVKRSVENPAGVVQLRIVDLEPHNGPGGIPAGGSPGLTPRASTRPKVKDEANSDKIMEE